jgi:hypothetical protein
VLKRRHGLNRCGLRELEMQKRCQWGAAKRLGFRPRLLLISRYSISRSAGQPLVRFALTFPGSEVFGQ